MPDETNMKKLENGRAEFAYKYVVEVSKLNSKTASDYKS